MPVAALSILAALILMLAAATPARAFQCDGNTSAGVGANSYVVYFDVGQTAINDAGRTELDRAAKQAKATFVQEICIIGQADKQGDKESNRRLAEDRAETVQAYLANRGVKRATMEVAVRGETFGGAGFLESLVSSNDRRVEVVFLR